MKAVGDIEEYLAYVGRQRGSGFGRRFRSQFRDLRGTSELAMLAAPSAEEYEEFQRAVAVMTGREKQNVELLSDEQIQDIADRAEADYGTVGIFLSGYVLACKNERMRQQGNERTSKRMQEDNRQ